MPTTTITMTMAVRRSFAIATTLLLGTSIMVCEGQLTGMVRKRASPVLEIEDINPFSDVVALEDNMGHDPMSRRLASGSDSGGGYGSSDHKEEKYFAKHLKSDKSNNGYFKGDKKWGLKADKSKKSDKKNVYTKKEKGRLWEEDDTDYYYGMNIMFSSMSMQPSAPTPSRPSTPTTKKPTTIPPTDKPATITTPTAAPVESSNPKPVTTPTAAPVESSNPKPVPTPTAAPVESSTPKPVTPTAAPQPKTLSPTPIPSSIPTLSRADSIKATLEEVTESSILEDPTTPQGMAFEWIVKTDPAQIDPPSSSDNNDNDVAAVKQRYAVASFYYSTNGNDWTNSNGWLSSIDECTWVGLNCNGDGSIVEIGAGGELGKFYSIYLFSIIVSSVTCNAILKKIDWAPKLFVDVSSLSHIFPFYLYLFI
jgi:hypothetical protein